MKTLQLKSVAMVMGLLFLLPIGCTIHPRGEMQMRRAATKAGQPFQKQWSKRKLPRLAVDAGANQLVAYALLNSPVVEEAYWQWRAAIEKIPQAGTEMTTPMLTGATSLAKGSFSAANTSIGLANMGSSDIRWPSKPDTEAKIALEKAAAAQWNYQASCFAVRRDVLNAWYSYARAAELLRLARRNIAILNSMEDISRAQIESGSGTVSKYLLVQDELARMKERIIAMQSALPEKLAQLNAVLGRDPTAPLKAPSIIPAVSTVNIPMTKLLMLAAQRNPALGGLRRLKAAGILSISRARMQYIPNFDLGASTSLDGLMDNFSGAIMFPIVRYQAINASIRQARANFRATTAKLRGVQNNLSARLVSDLILLRSDQSQLAIVHSSLLPRLRQIRSLSMNDYQQGRAGLDRQVATDQTILDIQESAVDLQIDSARRVADIDAIIAAPIEHGVSPKH